METRCWPPCILQLESCQGDEAGTAAARLFFHGLLELVQRNAILAPGW